VKVKIVENQQELQDAYFVRKTVFIEEQNVPLEIEIDEHEDESTHFVLYDNGEPVGAGRIRILDGIGKVERICVLKEKRKSGAGKVIMDRIEEYAKAQGIKGLKLNAQTHAIPFYNRLGYSIVSEEFLDAGIPHKAMKKILKKPGE
jgi:predicted GNAT family N-acyltransferase